MRWSSVLLPFSLLFAGVFADDPSERFVEFQKKALSSSPVKLDDASYKKITAAPRDYSIAVLLTAQDARYGCQMCREFGPELDLLSTQWTKGDKAGNSRVLFALLDFNDGRDTFMSVSTGTGHQTTRILFPSRQLAKNLTSCFTLHSARSANGTCTPVLPTYYGRIRGARPRSSALRLQLWVRPLPHTLSHSLHFLTYRSESLAPKRFTSGSFATPQDALTPNSRDLPIGS